jgi:DNA-binding NarL/FixJ family response regulator
VPRPVTPEKTGVGIVETDEKSRGYLAAVIEGTPGLAITHACPTGKAALACFEHHPPQVLLVDLFLADMSGTDLIWQARRRWPQAASLLMISEQHHGQYLEALESSASGYLSKPCPPEELVRAIRTVRQGGAVLPAFLVKTVTNYFRARGAVIRGLTFRERQVLGCLSCGFSQQETALQLAVTEATVQAHVRSLRARLDVHSTAEILSAYFNPKDLRNHTIPVVRQSGSSPGRISTTGDAQSIGAQQVLRRA